MPMVLLLFLAVGVGPTGAELVLGIRREPEPLAAATSEPPLIASHRGPADA